VPYNYQRDAAYNAVRTLVDVRDVNNHFQLRPSVSAGDVKTQIQKALLRNAQTDAANIHVSTDGGKVTLSGSVRSWSELDEAEHAAWAAPGVHEVQNHLAVIA
jgi:osmotically-inducible protein OsmY